MVRNLGSLLRQLLGVATYSYSNRQLPSLIAQNIFQIAAIRTMFPLDLSLLVSFLGKGESIHGKGGHLDNYHLMLSRGAKAHGLEKALHELYREASELWPRRGVPQSFLPDQQLWVEKGDGLSAKLYYQGIRDFHNRK